MAGLGVDRFPPFVDRLSPLRLLVNTLLHNLGRREVRRMRTRRATLGLLAILLAALAVSLAAPASAQRYASSLRGTVYAWTNGELHRVPHVAVSTGLAQIRTDDQGRFEFSADQRSGRLTAVKPGFHIVRRAVYGDRVIIVLRELVVRGVFVSFAALPQTRIQNWIRDLVERDLINAIVMDVKEEGGRVAHFAATPATDEINATTEAPDVAEFLAELGEMGVYRIGRVVTFLDTQFAIHNPQDALHHVNGTLFRDGSGLRWSSPFSPAVRRYNVEIAVAAARHIDEVQFDYVRLPYESGLAERGDLAERQAAITAFAEEAAEALHLAGAAVSFDVFGDIAVSGSDSGIGQSLLTLSRHLDYLSPMLYPSGWHAGSFGIAYPPARPGLVIRHSMAATLSNIDAQSHVEIRPWLQDFTDYQERGVWYGAAQVSDQIREAAGSGGYGFLLWDPTLSYQEVALEATTNLVWSPRWTPTAN